MSQKRAHRLRSVQGSQREREYRAWLECKPHPIHFIAYLRWKRSQPRRIDF